MGTVWDRATEFLSDNLSAILPLALLAIFVPVSISQSLGPLTKMGGSAAMGFQLVSFVLSIVSLWGQLAIMALALDAAGGRASATAAANRRLLPVIGISLVLLIGVFVLMLPFGIALALSGFDFQAAVAGGKAELPPGVNAFLGLYLLIFACLLAWLAARLLLVTPTVIMERRGLGAIGRSFKLTRPVQWKIIGVILLYLIIWSVSVLAAKFVFGAVFGMIAGGDGPVTLGSVLASILESVVLTAFAVLAAAFTAKLYLAVRDAREAIVDSA
ncbi:hypothetical protein ABC974_03860 [Sphingomonas oligophenolica]|uniref:Glycerophosphoryl diester phosphodiesterase membrane domain-containing protein n=1 Tax=Sphingomonas oligophenolica TaxID=301154 RepID=A0ABU9XYY4_9SPHN